MWAPLLMDLINWKKERKKKGDYLIIVSKVQPPVCQQLKDQLAMVLILLISSNHSQEISLNPPKWIVGLKWNVNTYARNEVIYWQNHVYICHVNRITDTIRNKFEQKLLHILTRWNYLLRVESEFNRVEKKEGYGIF